MFHKGPGELLISSSQPRLHAAGLLRGSDDRKDVFTCGRRGVCPAPQASKGCEKTHKDTGRGCQTSQRESLTQRGREKNRDPPWAGRRPRVNFELGCEPLDEKPRVKTELASTMLKGTLSCLSSKVTASLKSPQARLREPGQGPQKSSW